jgi:hypothetical protein
MFVLQTLHVDVSCWLPLSGKKDGWSAYTGLSLNLGFAAEI